MPEKSGLIVVDAYVVLKWQLDDEECVDQAVALRDDYYQLELFKLIAPSLMVYEVVNGLATASRRIRLDKEQAIQAVSNLLEIGIELRETDPVRIMELAFKHNLAAYDAAYLALAETEQCDLWTGDRAFYLAVNKTSSRVKWIGDYLKQN